MPAACALQLKPSSSGVKPEQNYNQLLEMIRNLLDGQMDSNQFEDAARELFFIHAYPIFTVDKLIQNMVKQVWINFYYISTAALCTY